MKTPTLPSPGSKPDPIRVAIVDDDASVRVALDRRLRAAGVQTFCYATAEEYLARSSEDATDCLVLDFHLEGMTGLQFLARLNGASPHPPVILITAHDDVPDGVAHSDPRIVGLLRKPIDGLALMAAIERAVSSGA
jgi:FixJ family two-component response regulator